MKLHKIGLVLKAISALTSMANGVCSPRGFQLATIRDTRNNGVLLNRYSGANVGI
jgi:hypothetical protein